MRWDYGAINEQPARKAASITAFRRKLPGLLISALLTPVAHAQLPTARLDSIFPPGIRAGTDTEITISGPDLDGADRLLFSDAGLSATRVEGAKFKVTASGGMAPGIYEVRAVGKYGITASRAFIVGTLPELNESGDNTTLAKAVQLTLPATVNGQTGGEAADHFKFHASKDQRFTLSCAAGRVDSPLNAVLSIHDTAGHELTSVHRTRQAEAVLDFTAPAEGDYIVKVHDIAWQAGAYRISIASPEEITSANVTAMPLAGAVCEFAAATVTATIASPAANEAAAHKVTLPAVLSLAGGARDWFEFTGTKDRRIILDVLSHRLGEPSDFLLQVFKVTRDDKGQEKSERVAEFDDKPAPTGLESLQLASRDPSGVFTCEDATYRVQATDRFKARRPWRLVLRDVQPGFSLVAFSVSPVTRGQNMHRWSPFLRRGGSALVQVAVLRGDGFDAPVTVRMTELPEGVSAGEVTVPTGVASASLVVRAAADAKSWSGRIKITGTSGDQTVTAREAIPRWSVGNTSAERLEMRLSRDGFVLAVTEAENAPLGIEPAEPKTYETAIGGSIEVPVKFLRDATLKGFKGEWEAMLMGLPGLSKAPVVKPPGDAKEAKLVLNVHNKDGNQFQPGTWTMHATAHGTIQWKLDEAAPQKELSDAVWSAPITLKIDPSPVFLKVPASVTVAPGAKVEVPVKLERRYGFAEAVSFELIAPESAKGLSAENLGVAKESPDGILIITAAADVAQGAHEVQIKAKCAWNGVEVPWSVKLNVEVKP